MHGRSTCKSKPLMPYIWRHLGKSSLWMDKKMLRSESGLFVTLSYEHQQKTLLSLSAHFQINP